jgi:hypothetical protein
MQDLEKELMPQTARVIEKVNGRIKKFAKEKDRTIKLFGFKIPIEGFLI